MSDDPCKFGMRNVSLLIAGVLINTDEIHVTILTTYYMSLKSCSKWLIAKIIASHLNLVVCFASTEWQTCPE